LIRGRTEGVEIEAFVLGEFVEIEIRILLARLLGRRGFRDGAVRATPAGAVGDARGPQHAEHANHQDPVIPFVFWCHDSYSFLFKFVIFHICYGYLNKIMVPLVSDT